MSESMAGEDGASWWALELGDAIMAQAEVVDIREAFERQDRAAGCVYVRYRTVASLHCHVTAFFSPAAGALGRELGAVACASPGLAGLELVAGTPTGGGDL